MLICTASRPRGAHRHLHPLSLKQHIAKTEKLLSAGLLQVSPPISIHSITCRLSQCSAYPDSLPGITPTGPSALQLRTGGRCRSQAERAGDPVCALICHVFTDPQSDWDKRPAR